MAMYYLFIERQRILLYCDLFLFKKIIYAKMLQKKLPKNSRALAATLDKKNCVSSHFFYSATLIRRQAGIRYQRADASISRGNPGTRYQVQESLGVTQVSGAGVPPFLGVQERRHLVHLPAQLVTPLRQVPAGLQHYLHHHHHTHLQHIISPP